MAMTLCAAGKHYYDSAVQSGCPYCGESASSGSPHTAAIPAALEERTQMLAADSHQLAAQSAKTQMLDNAAPAAESDSTLKTHILGVSNRPDAEARAKGMCEFPVVGWLIITEGQGRGTDFRLIQGENRIGRNSGNDVVINRQQVSGSHCRISVDTAGNVVLEDLQSTNGTFVDSLEQRISRTTLRPGQTIYLANRDIAYQLTQS